MNIMKRIAVVLGAGGVGVSLLVAACDRKADAAAAATPVAVVGSSSAATATYTIELKPAASYKKGVEGTFEVIVKTKGEYHVNEEYPTKLTPEKVPEVTYAQPKLEKLKDPTAFALTKCGAGSKDSCTMVVTVKFTPQAGATKVAAVLSFGVCNKDSCQIEKKTLDADIKVN